MPSTHAFVLLHTEDASGTDLTFRSLPLPTRPSHLLVRAARRSGRPGRSASRRRKPSLSTRLPRRAVRITFEPVTVQHRRYLLMLADIGSRASGVPAFLNGMPVRPVNLLRVQDELSVDGERFFVSAQRDVAVMRPQEHHLGHRCPFCRLTIQAATRVYECANCHAVLHCEDETYPAESRLACAEMASVCPNCEHDIEFEAGLQWEPAL